MGFQIRWWKNFGPFRINLSRSGPTFSVGGKRARVNASKRGVRATGRVPGEGAYVSKSRSWKRLFGRKRK